jgi:1-acyl-sn-glycerol-3-phosphate acyltransferase
MLRALLLYGLMPLVCLVLILVAGVCLVGSLGLLRWPIIRVVCRAFGRSGLWLAGIRLEITGQEHLEETRPRVMIQNHGSMLDFLVAAVLAPPRILVVTKKSVRWLFPLNIGLWVVGTIFVDRKRRGSSVERLRKISGVIARSKRTIVLSPEGTRTRTGELLPFKSGSFHIAQQAIAEIVPVVIHGAFDLCPPDGIKIRPGTLKVEVKEPIPAPPADADMREVASDVGALYRGWLAEPGQSPL